MVLDTWDLDLFEYTNLMGVGFVSDLGGTCAEQMGLLVNIVLVLANNMGLVVGELNHMNC